ncbi:site-2 protease family protein [Rubeoparvulum massiliense]|uniref:site-2 protease family protein n=1 Tax=Rubeoparvulum massiliense TaxID=1631346 RepID=UPI00065DC835|nr:site-2 protease family protein [Rubeoparvulum massiliense]
MSSFFHFDLESLLFRVVAFTLAFTIHEWAHAFVATRLGDRTALMAGRLTLNPIAHVDPLGLLMILFGPFGWAKPVPTNPSRFRGNIRRGILLVSLAGPISNLILAILFAIIFSQTSMSTWIITYGDHSIQALFTYIVWYSIMINTALFVFNMLPVAPLDGSKVLHSLLPLRYDWKLQHYQQYGPFILLLIVFIDPLREFLLGRPLLWVMDFVMKLGGM